MDENLEENVETNPDFKDLLRALNEENARYLLIGAYAVAFYSEPRYTKDIDFWIASHPTEIDKLWRALEKFGAPLSQISKEDLMDPETVYQIGVEPNRIDLIVQPTTLNFDEAWKRKNTSTYDGELIHIVSLDDLIKLKKAAGRPHDLEDVRRLEESKSSVS